MIAEEKKQAEAGQHPYYSRPEVSNSDLSWLHLQTQAPSYVMDFKDALRFGNLVDAIITEPHRVDFLRFRVDGEQFGKDEFMKANEMKKAFRADPFCAQMFSVAGGQTIFDGDISLNYGGMPFTLRMRCKYDLWSSVAGFGADIKSTAATSQKSFEEAVLYFNYDRQRVCYMKLSGATRDMIIGISKVNNKIFKVPITVGSELWISGEEKMNELAFKWWAYFNEF